VALAEGERAAEADQREPGPGGCADSGVAPVEAAAARPVDDPYGQAGGGGRRRWGEPRECYRERDGCREGLVHPDLLIAEGEVRWRGG
jgi:hypothetical protein